MKALCIYFVENQERSRDFYSRVLNLEPSMHVPGMTEFTLPDGTLIGFMPNAGIKRLLGDDLPDPASALGIPRSEIYLMVDDPETYHQRALRFGAKEIQPLRPMGWGQEVAYSLDLDGQLLAFAKATD
jgi:uncharacterized protein